MNLPTPSLQELPNFLRQAITKEIEHAATEEIEEAKKRMEKRSAEIVASVVLHVEKQLQIQTLDNHLVIKVELRQ